MRLANTRTTLQAVLLSASLASTAMADSSEPCSLADRENIASDISCGTRELVNNCLSDLAQDEGLLQVCLIGAGCSLSDARHEAEQVARRCETSSDSEESNIELRKLRARHGLRTIREVVEVRTAQTDDDDDDSAGTTLATVAIRDETTTAAPTSINTWVMVQHLTGTTYTTVTCMTPATVATSACSFINDAEDTACVATTAVVPSCVPGMMCAFNKGNGSVRCAQTGGMGTAGIVVAGILGVAAAIAVTIICTMCCRERRKHKRDRRAAEAQAAMAAAAEAKKASSRAATSMAGSSDYVPLMGASGAERPGQADPFRGGQQYYDSR